MNYQHDFHAGNFADVVKHVILARVLVYMTHKPRPFRVIDTHAGAGLYDLAGEAALKTGEWRDGIARLINADLPPAVAGLTAPYLDTVRAINEPGELRFYPGSPVIARRLMRPGDVLVANELNAEDCERLKGELRRFKATSVLNIDAWHAVKSLLPPKERRGVVLIDPPFEDPNEFAKLTDAVEEARTRFATGVYLIWYPLKNVATADSFVANATARAGLAFLDVRFTVSAPFAGLGLTATGVLVLNPPYVLRGELQTLLPAVLEHLAEGEGARIEVRAGAE